MYLLSMQLTIYYHSSFPNHHLSITHSISLLSFPPSLLKSALPKKVRPVISLGSQNLSSAHILSYGISGSDLSRATAGLRHSSGIANHSGLISSVLTLFVNEESIRYVLKELTRQVRFGSARCGKRGCSRSIHNPKSRKGECHRARVRNPIQTLPVEL